MLKIWQIKKANWLVKLFTHISGAIILLLNNNIKDIPYLILLTLIVVFANYIRQFYLVAFSKPIKYQWVSIAVELIFILCIGLFDRTSYMLFFFACISETIIYYEFKYSGAFMIVSFVIARSLSDILLHRMTSNTDLLLDIFLSCGVPIAFVTGTSYFVRSQIREKEKLARMNMEIEEAYRNLIDASAASEQLSIEKERVRMAREIHDTLAHTLTSLIVQLEACKKLSLVDTGRLLEELEKAQELTRSGLNDVKRTIKSLRPQALEEKPFFECVLDFINNTMNNTEVHIILNNNLPQDMKLSTTLEITIFRIIQESITNSIRHGHSKEIEITMNLYEGIIQINIHDNGAGCSRIKKGFGLSGIQERLEVVGGWADFLSTIGNGFTTKVSIPQGGANE
ncbi:MAG: sensor histidine kinase [Bacillota bacterium]|nr:sensor histidine kinase [Bacillota bacterium]